MVNGRGQLTCDGTRAETRIRLSVKRNSPFKSVVASVQSTTGSRGVRISGSNAGYTMFRGSVKSTGYPLHSPVSPSLPLPCATGCHPISTGVYFLTDCKRTSPFKSVGASVQSTTGSRGVRISGSNGRYTMFRGSVKSTGYPLHLNWWGRQFSRLLAAEVCASAVVMLDTPCSEVV